MSGAARKGSIAKLGTLLAPALIAIAGVATLGSPMTASACGCGSWKGPIVASGRSAGGVGWNVQAFEYSKGEFQMEFYYRWNGELQGEYGFGVGSFPRRGIPLIDGTQGSGYGPANESDFAGIVSWRTKEIVIVMESGTRIRVKPLVAPLELRNRWPWIKSLRFYDQFFAGTEEPSRLLALNKAGEVIARMNQ